MGRSGRVVGASDCRASPNPGTGLPPCRRVTQQFHRQDVPRIRDSRRNSAEPPATGTPSGRGGARGRIRVPLALTQAISRPSQAVPGRQTPPNDDQGQPTAPDKRPAQSLDHGSELVGDGRVGLYAGFCPRRVPRGPTPAAVIHLGLPLPAGSSGLPADIGRAALERLRGPSPCGGGPSWPCSGWGLPSHPGHPGCWWALTPPFHPYRRRGPGGLFSVALSRGSPRVAVSNHPALWSPDVPRRRAEARRRDRPADSSVARQSSGAAVHHPNAVDHDVIAIPRVCTQHDRARSEPGGPADWGRGGRGLAWWG